MAFDQTESSYENFLEEVRKTSRMTAPFDHEYNPSKYSVFSQDPKFRELYREYLTELVILKFLTAGSAACALLPSAASHIVKTFLPEVQSPLLDDYLLGSTCVSSGISAVGSVIYQMAFHVPAKSTLVDYCIDKKYFRGRAIEFQEVDRSGQ